MTDKIIKLLDAANARLKLANAGIRIFKRGSKLSLRGMLPPKPGSGKQKYSQQTISLGFYANAAGIKTAEKQAQKLGATIALGEFDWTNYLSSSQAVGNVEYWLNKFEKDYFNKRDRNSKSETTFQDYQKIFKKLDRNSKLSQENLMAVVLSTKPNTRTRQKACTYLKALASFADIDFDPSEYAGNYSPDSVELRDIPTDKEIMQWRESFSNRRGWQYAFGLMAAYGLRNHELFYVDLESIKKPPGHLRIVESKRGKKRERFLWCLYPEWYFMWDLGNIEQPFPSVTGKTNSDLGDRVNKAFKRYGFANPYNLRHAWAIRSIGFLPVELAAPMMDHKVDEHVRTYHRWIKMQDYDRFYKLIMSRDDRPKPPI